MRERGREQGIRIEFATDRVGQLMSVANQHALFCFAFAMRDPSDHDQREGGQGQDDDKRQHA